MTSDEKWLLEEKYGGKKTPQYAVDRMRLAFGEPLAYLIGCQPFLGLKIYLDSRPLIPRVETEWWVEKLVAAMRKVWPSEARRPEDFPKGGNEFRFLDLCAGSGAIGCAALARLPNARVYFGEIDPAHQPTIEKNVHENNLEDSRADIRIGDLFEPFGDMQFNFIAINPPYIPVDRALPRSIVNYEPALALRAGVDGLSVIRRIAVALPLHLARGGQAWIECDSTHAKAACTLFEASGLSTRTHTDQYDAPRVIVVSFL